MPRFRFKIVDSQGRRRSGLLRADSLEVAETALRSKLCQIEELTLLPGEGEALEVGQLSRSFSRADAIRRAFVVLLGCFCIISLLYWARLPREKSSPSEPNKVVEFVVRGELDLRALGSSLDPSDLKVYAVFPELPYEVEGTLAEHGKSFSLPVSLVAARPTTLLLEVALDGQRWRVANDVRVATMGDLQLGALRVPRPPAEPEVKLLPVAGTNPGKVASASGEGSQVRKKRTGVQKLLRERRRHR